MVQWVCNSHTRADLMGGVWVNVLLQSCCVPGVLEPPYVCCANKGVGLSCPPLRLPVNFVPCMLKSNMHIIEALRLHSTC